MPITRFAVPRPDEIIGPAIDALVAARPQVFRHLQGGPTDSYYARVVKAGWRAQAALLLAQIGDEVASTRLGLATGPALLDLAADEYQTVVDASPTLAYGSVTLARTGIAGGAIRAGKKFRRVADPTQQPPVLGASYSALADVIVLPNVTSGIVVPLVADTPGSAANAPIVSAGDSTAPLGVMQVADLLFDPTFEVTAFDAAGGSDGLDEDSIRAEAKAYSVGQYAPTDDAITAGALRGTGVKYAAIRDFTEVFTLVMSELVPSNAAFTSVVIADQSWATSLAWRNQVQQSIATNFQGFGCAIRMGTVTNVVASLTAAVVLRDARSLGDTSEIDAAIQAAVSAYFDLRPDWYVFRYAQIRAVIAHADRRILTCTAAQLLDSTGTPIAEPSAPIAAPSVVLTHWMVPQGSTLATYNAPS